MLEFRNSNHFKSYMKREASRLNINIGVAYTTFFARDLLSKISLNYNDSVLIKGSSAEIAYLGRLVRAITDVDLASASSMDSLRPIVISAMNDKATQINYSFAREDKVTRTGIFQLSLLGKFDGIRQPLGIDAEAGYSRLIEPEIRMVSPLFEGDTEFPIYVPSYEEYLAEKLCIIIESNKPEMLNTRVKDFYDIYQLHGGSYDPDKLTEYFGKMLEFRNKTTIENADTRLLNGDFIEKHKDVWNHTRDRYGFLDKEISLDGAVFYTRSVLREQLLKNGQEMPDNIPRTYTMKKATK